MINDVSGVFLRIFIGGNIYDIPFKDFQQLDAFTVQFVDEKDLITKLFSDYNNLFDGMNNGGVYINGNRIRIEINYVYKNGKNLVTKKAPIKFIDDNYDEEDLERVYRRYLYGHHNELFLDKWKVNYTLTNGRLKCGKSSDALVTESELELAIKSVLSKGYKTKRDIYFALKAVGASVQILPTESYDDRQLSLNDRIGAIKSTDPYVGYLQGALKNDKDSRDFVMEQLLMFDLDELTHMDAPFDGSTNLPTVWEKLDVLLEHSERLSAAKRKLLVKEVGNIRDSLYSRGKKKCQK